MTNEVQGPRLGQPIKERKAKGEYSMNPQAIKSRARRRSLPVDQRN
ncbi:hypothetical protein FPSE_04842 [Fusarium pseudograminearum CS3096]|uniref:Uncharacterized protein n=1 Tax=Fusarium pseudograminearum (strain CS3096) TaxID=1028729 RepID=K3W0Y3_FUSPC|nr:hypothetical protein FPSE_04842 [Fusarium pseudograminearum CS3096]EKJ74950.1 hypothetical protein FPSE_04842 [Fusarium pseudograminearum CS3096]